MTENVSEFSLMIFLMKFEFLEFSLFDFTKIGNKAWLISELISTPTSGCLNWWMHLFGKAIFL